MLRDLANTVYRKLETAGKAMKEMRKMTFFHRLRLKDKHATQLVEHRQGLQDAVAKFQASCSLLGAFLVCSSSS